MQCVQKDVQLMKETDIREMVETGKHYILCINIHDIMNLFH
jgi:hypothetical protein